MLPFPTWQGLSGNAAVMDFVVTELSPNTMFTSILLATLPLKGIWVQNRVGVDGFGGRGHPAGVTLWLLRKVVLETSSGFLRTLLTTLKTRPIFLRSGPALVRIT